MALFLARTLGDLTYVGLFKRIKESPFAKRDTLIYTPLSGLITLLLASLI